MGSAARFMAALRKLDLAKAPSIAETLDWTQALVALDQATLDPETVDATLGVLLHRLDPTLRIHVFADGADLPGLVALSKNPLIRGFTTNPTLMRR